MKLIHLLLIGACSAVRTEEGCIIEKFDESNVTSCTCHPSCKMCGYGETYTDTSDKWPNKANQCITCKADTDEVVKQPGKDFGTCVPKNRVAVTSGCVTIAGDHKNIVDCKCHESCKMCGYGPE